MSTFRALFAHVSLLTLVAASSCNGRTVCDNDGICNPNTGECVASNATYECGKYGKFLNCGDTGVVVGECGSGGKDDCTDYSQNLCPDDSDIFEGIDCNYQGLLPNNGTNGFTNTTDWICGKYGTYLSCQDYSGSVIIGVCGAGRKEDCQQYCDGYHAIQCASTQYFTIDWDSCKWQKGGYGEWLYCDSGEIATGHCGSGYQENCGFEVVHAIQCCKFEYS